MTISPAYVKTRKKTQHCREHGLLVDLVDIIVISALDAVKLFYASIVFIILMSNFTYTFNMGCN